MEAASGSVANYADVHGSLTQVNWEYRFDVKEAGVNSWPAGSSYTIEVFDDGVLIDTLYITNATADAANVEGATVKVDLGLSDSGLPSNISLKIR